MIEFKLVVAGGRDFSDYTLLSAAITQLGEKKLIDRAVSIISGMARGADAMAAQFARENNVALYEFTADWQDLEATGAVVKYDHKGRAYNATAGFIRNRRMADNGDGLLAFWDGKSHGTKHMIRTMQAMGKPVWVLNYQGALIIQPDTY